MAVRTNVSETECDLSLNHPAVGETAGRLTWMLTFTRFPDRQPSRPADQADDGHEHAMVPTSIRPWWVYSCVLGRVTPRRSSRSVRRMRTAATSRSTRPASRTHPDVLTRDVAPADHDGRACALSGCMMPVSRGTALDLRGVPMAVIAKWLGHADAATTARIYAHSQDEALRAASTTLGQVVRPGG